MLRWLNAPIHICLVGVLVLSLGVSSAVVDLWSLVMGRGEFYFGFLLIFIGLGLLRGSWLQRNLFLGVMSLVLIAVTAVALPGLLSFSHEGAGSQRIAFWIWAGVYLSLVYCVLVLLASWNNKWFSEKFSQKAPPCVIPITVVLSLMFAVYHELEAHRREADLAKIYRYDFEVVAKDRETGEVIGMLTTSWYSDIKELGEGGVPVRMLSSGGAPGKFRKSSARFWGYSHGPVWFRFEKEGYQIRHVEVNRNTGAQIEFFMVPDSA